MSDARDRWIAQWTETVRRERALKNASSIPTVLAKQYQELSPEDRLDVDRLLAEWAALTEWAAVGKESKPEDIDDQDRWFSAMALIDEFRIRSAIPAVRRSVEQFGRMPGPLARDWREHVVQRVLPRLESDTP